VACTEDPVRPQTVGRHRGAHVHVVRLTSSKQPHWRVAPRLHAAPHSMREAVVFNLWCVCVCACVCVCVCARACACPVCAG
jgi:hypothetical protein